MLSAASTASSSASPYTTYSGLRPETRWRGSSSLLIGIKLLRLRFGAAQAAHDLLHHVGAHALVKQGFFGFLGENLGVVINVVAAQHDFLGGDPVLSLEVISTQRNPVAQLEFVHAPAAAQREDLLLGDLADDVEHHIGLFGRAHQLYLVGFQIAAQVGEEGSAGIGIQIQSLERHPRLSAQMETAGSQQERS